MDSGIISCYHEEKFYKTIETSPIQFKIYDVKNQLEYFLNNRDTFVPPKPKEFFNA